MPQEIKLVLWIDGQHEEDAETLYSMLIHGGPLRWEDSDGNKHVLDLDEVNFHEF